MWSTAISAEKYTLHASRYHARGDRFLYGYYNSEKPLIQVKICTAVDKEKGRRTKCHLAFSADFQKQ